MLTDDAHLVRYPQIGVSVGAFAPAGITAVRASAKASCMEMSGLGTRCVPIVFASKATCRSSSVELYLLRPTCVFSTHAFMRALEM